MRVRLRIRVFMKNTEHKSVPMRHPCGDCANYGDLDCMENMLECEYSDKEAIKNIDNKSNLEGGIVYGIN